MVVAAGASPAAGSSSKDIMEGKSIPIGMLSFLSDFAANCRTNSTRVMLLNLSALLTQATTMAGKGKTIDLIPVCKLLPPAMCACLNEEDVAELHPNREEFHAQIFEVLCRLVDFTVTFLYDFVADPASQTLKLPSLEHVLEALCTALDSNMRYYRLLRENNRTEIRVRLPSGLETALRMPGYLVKLFGATDGKTHYFCSRKGVNQQGVTCKCCTPPANVDAVLVNVFWQLAHTTHGSGYECLLNVLSTYQEPMTLELMVLLLRPIANFLQYYVIDNSWRVILQHMERTFSKVGEMMRMSHTAYHKVWQKLTKALNLHFMSVVYLDRKLFIEALVHLHTIPSWSVEYSRDCLCAEGAVLSYEDVGQLQILFLEGTVSSGMISSLYSIIEESREAATSMQASGNDVAPFVKCILSWLKEKKLILNKLPLLGDSMAFLPREMIKLIEFVGKEGPVLQQEEFVAIINHDLVSENWPQKTQGVDEGVDEKKSAQAQIVAILLDNFDLDPYTPESMNDVCDWLERWQAEDFVIDCLGIRCILEKLIACDKGRKLENRLLNLLSESAFVDCLTKIACHYTVIQCYRAQRLYSPW